MARGGPAAPSCRCGRHRCCHCRLRHRLRRRLHSRAVRPLITLLLDSRRGRGRPGGPRLGGVEAVGIDRERRQWNRRVGGGGAAPPLLEQRHVRAQLRLALRVGVRDGRALLRGGTHLALEGLGGFEELGALPLGLPEAVVELVLLRRRRVRATHHQLGERFRAAVLQLRELAEEPAGSTERGVAALRLNGGGQLRGAKALHPLQRQQALRLLREFRLDAPQRGAQHLCAVVALLCKAVRVVAVPVAHPRAAESSSAPVDRLEHRQPGGEGRDHECGQCAAVFFMRQSIGVEEVGQRRLSRKLGGRRDRRVREDP